MSIRPQCRERFAALKDKLDDDERWRRRIEHKLDRLCETILGNGGRGGLKDRVNRNSTYLKLIGAAIVLIPSLVLAYVALTR